MVVGAHIRGKRSKDPGRGTQQQLFSEDYPGPIQSQPCSENERWHKTRQDRANPRKPSIRDVHKVQEQNHQGTHQEGSQRIKEREMIIFDKRQIRNTPHNSAVTTPRIAIHIRLGSQR